MTSAFHPAAEALPAEFAVFPLAGALLLPTGNLPLNIFERRYLAMTEDSLAAGRMFGMIQPDASRPANETGPALFRVGCLGRLTSFSETDDGRYLITLHGVIRFAVATELEPRRGYRRVRGDFGPYMGDLRPEENRPLVDRPALIDALRTYFARRGFEANWDAIDAMPDHTLVVTIAMVCPFDPIEKQALLEAPARDLGETLLALLQMGGAEGEDDGGLHFTS